MKKSRNRRNNRQRGFVKFPIGNPKYENTKEGGMFVRLVVEEGNHWGRCNGGQNMIMMDETYLRDNNRRYCNFRSLKKQQEFSDQYEKYHFPNINNKSKFRSQFISRGYLTVMTIGTTGWSGWNKKYKEYWHCKVNNLTEDGKTIYDLMHFLYPGCKIRLQTWLDT